MTKEPCIFLKKDVATKDKKGIYDQESKAE